MRSTPAPLAASVTDEPLARKASALSWAGWRSGLIAELRIVLCCSVGPEYRTPGIDSVLGVSGEHPGIARGVSERCETHHRRSGEVRRWRRTSREPGFNRDCFGTRFRSSAPWVVRKYPRAQELLVVPKDPSMYCNPLGYTARWKQGRWAGELAL